MADSRKLKAFWRAFRESTSRESLPERYNDAWGFGNTPKMADELGALVVDGVKTATCGLLWQFEAENEPLPKVGDLDIVLDGNGDPLCVIELTEVEIKPYNEVDAQFAYEEGEGDRSLDYWRKLHWEFFGEICEEIGRELDEAMPLVCQRFRVVYS